MSDIQLISGTLTNPSIILQNGSAPTALTCGVTFSFEPIVSQEFIAVTMSAEVNITDATGVTDGLIILAFQQIVSSSPFSLVFTRGNDVATPFNMIGSFFGDFDTVTPQAGQLSFVNGQYQADLLGTSGVLVSGDIIRLSASGLLQFLPG